MRVAAHGHAPRGRSLAGSET